MLLGEGEWWGGNGGVDGGGDGGGGDGRERGKTMNDI